MPAELAIEKGKRVIIFRYLAREVMFTMLAVSSVLLLITMSGRFVKYLAQAAAGQLDADVLFSIMLFRLPGFLELVLPLGLFIGILLAYGRLYMESEMTVLSACGFSQRQLTRVTLIPGLLVAAFVALLALVVTPMGVDKAELILNEQKKRSEFDGLNPGRFMSLSRSGAVSYTESLSADRTAMQQVFMAGQASGDGDVGVVRAQQGRQLDHPEFGQRYLVLNDGYRYEGKPGHQSYSVTKFAEQGQYLHVDDPGAVLPRKADRKTTSELWRSSALSDAATLHWRFSLPVLVLVVSILAVPLSKTNPRQGRYFKMIPAILLYIVYLVALNAARGAAEDGKVSVWVGIWGIHLAFLGIALLLMIWPDWLRKLSYRRSKEARHAPA